MLERFIERTLFASRWLLAPLYLGLALGLIALGVKFFQEAFHAIVHIFTMEEAELVLVVLALIDISLVGSLIVMVMFSGYENFVSRIDAATEKDTLGWLGALTVAVSWYVPGVMLLKAGLVLHGPLPPKTQ